MIELFEGTPGSGKSFCAIQDMLWHIIDGGVVAANFKMVPGWAEKLAVSSTILGNYRSPDYIRKKAIRFWKRAFFVGNANTCMQLSEFMKKDARSLERFCSYKWANKREGMGRLYIDEAQLYFNSRSWKDNMGFIEFFTQHRKLRWDIVIIAHSIDMIDKQIRPLIEMQRKFRNLQKVKFLGIPIAWKPLFIQAQYYAGMGTGAGMKAGMASLTPLNKKYANLYDSMEVFGFNKLSDRIQRQPAGNLFKKEKKRADRKIPSLYTGNIRGEYSLYKPLSPSQIAIESKKQQPTDEGNPGAIAMGDSSPLGEFPFLQDAANY